MDYCDVAYMQSNQGKLQKLQLWQNMACRIVLKVESRDHIKDMHNELKLDLLADRRRCHLLSECQKCIHSSDNYPLKTYFKLNSAV